jgi:hypothetical protein
MCLFLAAADSELLNITEHNCNRHSGNRITYNTTKNPLFKNRGVYKMSSLTAHNIHYVQKYVSHTAVFRVAEKLHFVDYSTLCEI